MSPLQHLPSLLLMAAIWGSSFLFMRVSVPEFGPLALAGVRVAGAAMLLVPLLAWRGQLSVLRQHAGPLALMGLMNTAIPFVCFAFAAQSITAGLSSILNATTPIWGAVLAWVILGQQIRASQVLGMLLALVGVVVLGAPEASFKAGGSGWAVLACLLAALFYGLGALYGKQRLGQLPPLTVAGGSQLFAALALLPATAWFWPAQWPSLASWGAVAALAWVCTGLALVLFFRLLAVVSPPVAMSVTFLIPVFGLLWGTLLLHEPFTLRMALGCAVVLLGTGLAVGVVQPLLKGKLGRSTR
ncbi:DMT family transporter [Roseateles sp. BYS180W]|uniref:DMT family transporter n=1 Tax=Roseateles rivi TaxID=3299028 RepID=A0ABW7FSH5_9BURK